MNKSSSDAQGVKPSLVDVRCSITVAVAFAELFAESHPEHRDAIAEFVKVIGRLSKELGQAVSGRFDHE